VGLSQLRRRHYRIGRKDKVKVITFPTYFDYKITIVFTHSIEKALKHYKIQMRVPPTPETVGLHVRGDFESHVFIPYDRGDTGTMVHEAYHAIWYMFEQHDLEMTNEAVAYHLGYLVNEMVELALR
jgi:hypothetical protein